MNDNVSLGSILHCSFPEVDSLDPVSYVSEVGDAVQALVYSRLFWPKLVEFNGAVFVALWGDDEAYIFQRLHNSSVGRDWAPMSWTSVVNSFNVFEVQYIFRQARGACELIDQANLELGSILIETWRARLATEYPERNFRVELVAADETMGSRIEVAQEYPPLASPEGWSDEQRAIIVDEPDRWLDGSS
ncbi:hypothetical protein ABTZ59_26835 [Streptomyces sp. NPDC094034]|uniref:hypothetical protein n=1 Tax=Streptomyces sp. NPDC094034 TaxID=3155309 RepID=UPI003321DDA3